MTFTVNRSSFVKELDLLRLAMERKQLIPVLSTVMMGMVGDELTVTATDLDITIIATIPASGDTWGGCLPCKQLHDLVRLFDEETIRFTEKPNGRMEISAGEGKHLLPVVPIAQFPEIQHPASETFTLPLPQLTSAIAATSFAMLDPRDEVKASDAVFTGLSLTAVDGTLTVAASRKSVTAVAEMPCETSFAILPPRGAVAAIGRLEGDSVTVSVDTERAKFTAGNRSITTRLLMGTFPNWRLFVPEYPYHAAVNIEALTAALRRAQVTLGDGVDPESMKVTVTSEQITIETRGGDHGQSLEPIAISSNLNGEPFTVGLFAHQVLNVLAKCGESVVCELATPESPIGITSESARYFVMPVRLLF